MSRGRRAAAAGRLVVERQRGLERVRGGNSRGRLVVRVGGLKRGLSCPRAGGDGSNSRSAAGRRQEAGGWGYGGCSNSREAGGGETSGAGGGMREPL